MGFFDKLKKITSNLFSGFTEADEAFFEELEETLIMADLGVDAATDAVEKLRTKVRKEHLQSQEAVREGLREILMAEMEVGDTAMKLDTKPSVCIFIGVNGVGKTTSIGKVAASLKKQGKRVLLCAADTFRAAAVEQLGIWAERTGSGFHSKGQDADPAAVAWEAMDVAIRDQYDILFIDTAGRLHTKSNLMDELHKIREVIARKHPGAPHRSILIVDATTGQNALQQTKIFKEAAGIDELILTKLDGTAKGGVAVAVSMQYGIPITYVGLGEKMEDLRPFNGDDFAKALLEQ